MQTSRAGAAAIGRPRRFVCLPDSIGCASCVDGIDEIIDVEFRDQSKKSVTFPMGSAPKEISALSEKLFSLEAKLQNELPIRK
jgi:hypothetical protein